MAKGKRIDILGSDMNLLKGEVKRTLVDLRAFIIREDSPLQERLNKPNDTNRPEASPDEMYMAAATSEKAEANSKRIEALKEALQVLKNQKPAPIQPQPQAPDPQPVFAPAPAPAMAYAPPPADILGPD